jgi:hypothetical protein
MRAPGAAAGARLYAPEDAAAPGSNPGLHPP